MRHLKITAFCTAVVWFIAGLLAAGAVQAQTISTTAGNGTPGYSGDNGAATSAEIDTVYGVVVSANGTIYFADTRNQRVRKIVNGTITTVAGTGAQGDSGDGGAATLATLSYPRAVAVDSQGNVYIADTGNCAIREVLAANGIMETIAGRGCGSTGGGFAGDGGLASAAQLSYPAGLAIDSTGNLYIADSWNYRIREITTDGKINTIAGNGSHGPFGDGGAATNAALGLIESLAVDGSGDVYLSDAYNHVVRKFAPGGTISTVAGGNFGPAVDGGSAVGANLMFPKGLAVDWRGSLFISDSLNHRVREVSPGGTISTAAGTGTPGYAGDNGAPTSAELDSPAGLGVDSGGDLVISDLLNYRLRGVSTVPTPRDRFVPVTPCRIADTRYGSGDFGAPSLAGGTTRSFTIPQSTCNIPATAAAYSLNITVVPAGRLGYLTVWPTGQTQPNVSTLNSWGGIVVANAAIVPAGTNGAISMFVSDQTDVILDINGYFTADGSGSALYALTPCRVVDTRNAPGQFGGPSMGAQSSRGFPFPSSACSIPGSGAAQAYSINATVVPHGILGYLTLWPAGQAQPLVSTLNSLTGKVVANAALVPAGSGGAVSAFVTNPTDLILDINGYFGTPGGPGALSFYTVAPCRVADTRSSQAITGGSSRAFQVPASGCGIPPSAQAYSLNVTVVPDGPLPYVTLWPTGQGQPYVSTLNSVDGSVVANAAIVPAGTNGSVSVFADGTTDVILDINGYFAP
jgi:sugar lactone lactonase YvrE